MQRNASDIILKYLIDNPTKVNSMRYFKYILKEVDYIIFFYIENLVELGSRITKANLEMAMQVNKLDWVDNNSIFMKDMGSPEITKTYIQSLTKQNLLNNEEYAEVLAKAVLKRYLEIESQPTVDDEEFKAVSNSSRQVSNVLFTQNMITQLVSLLRGEVPYLILDGVKYKRSDSLYFINTYVSKYQALLTPNVIREYNDVVAREFAESAVSIHPTIAFNLGKQIVSNPQPGNVISIVAAEKIGKTRFTIGELVFPTLIMGKNVKYFTGEMTPVEIRSLLLAKFMFTKGSIVDDKLIAVVLSCANSIKLGIATPEQAEFFRKVKHDIKAIILQSEYELFYSGKYGKLVISHISDNIDETGLSINFAIEKHFNMLRDELKSLPENERYALVVRDHLNHMSSSTGKSATETVTRYLQEAKKIATNKEMPFVYVIINHLPTKTVEQIKEQGNVDGIKLRGHNSNEEGKSCDLQLIFYERPGQAEEGMFTMVVENDRNNPILYKFKTKEFIMKSRREVCDFMFVGEQKSPYPTNDKEMVALINKNKK